jgi:hypothetical protein
VVKKTPYLVEFKNTQGYEHHVEDLNIYYQTIDEYEPRIFYQRCEKFPGKVAMSLQFMPSLNDIEKREPEP